LRAPHCGSAQTRPPPAPRSPIEEAPHAFRIDRWYGDRLDEQIAGVSNFEVAMATYAAAVKQWPNASLTLRQGARVIMRTEA
jgi:hypothetical protein